MSKAQPVRRGGHLSKDVERPLLARLAEAVKTKEPFSASFPLDVERYQNPERFQSERELFWGHPLVVAHVDELRESGDVITESVCGIGVVAAKDPQGIIRIFLNACRHRGAAVVEAPCLKGRKALVCPYHAWAYNLDGRLRHVPSADSFANLDTQALGLVEVPSSVQGGFVWAQIRGSDGAPDVARHLGPEIAADLDAVQLAEHRVHQKVEVERQCNWKLVMDAFAEGYHLRSLHSQSLARFFLDQAILDDFSPHARHLGARKNFVNVMDNLEDARIRDHATLFYNLFPNVILVFHPDWISQVSLFPSAPDRVRVVHRMLVHPEVLDSAKEGHLEKTFAHIHGQVFEKEDLRIAESIQSALATGANQTFITGGQERGLKIFHDALDRALAETREEK
jgi:phenylpropionate dioxygenase-like ring-hydroxylating dioxygenase large terminal subunit